VWVAIFISGVAGFIGSKLARHFVQSGEHVVGFDNLSRGELKNLDGLQGLPNFRFEMVDISDGQALRERFASHHETTTIREVWHMAANSDIPAGIADASVDLRDTFLTTHNLLAVMKETGVAALAFASSSAIYGDLGETSISEDCGPLLPISNYGAMKLASEAAISAAAESWLGRALIFRFPNVIGIPATHGVILDFIRRLRDNPDQLVVLGSGNQKKPYLHVDDLIDAMLFLNAQAPGKLGYFNIGPEDKGVTVRYIAETTVETVAPGASIAYGLEDRGWVGDVPRFSYSIDKIRSLGWHPKFGSAESIKRAVSEIARQESAV
jgi:UDP-glucose 4-epimerase